MIDAALVTAMLAGTPALAATNLVQNGSFESGLSQWVIGGSDVQGFPPAAIFYNNPAGYPVGAFGEAVPPDDSASLSPDAVGDRAAYFVSDFARAESLTQSIFLTPGRYEFGFSAFAPQNGFNNVGDAGFRATLLGNTIANYLVSSGPVRTWQPFSGLATIATAGFYNVSFEFDTDFNPSKDVVIDRVYVAAVPEPAAWAMLIVGFGLVGLARRRAGNVVAA